MIFPFNFQEVSAIVINDDPLHSNGTKFFAPKSLSNGLYIEVHAGTEQMLNNTYKLLERFEVSRDKLSIKEDMKNAES